MSEATPENKKNTDSIFFQGESASSQSDEIAPSSTDFVESQPSESVAAEEKNSRRKFLKQSSATLVVLGAATQVNGQESAECTGSKDNPLFQPEERWKERMKPPEDGKRYGWFVDTRRCFGCHGCEVSCKAENDVPLGHFIRQTFYKDVGDYPKVSRLFMPMSCQHCEDAPCIKACPCGALHKGPGGSVVIDYNTCCGHATCVEVCPYGALYIDPVANQAVKCHNCYHRLDDGMEPACANTCPADAIYFGDLNDRDSKVSRAMAEAEDNGVQTIQLRSEKGTRPRMWFAGDSPVEIEERIPQEGKSYSPESYNIYGWKEKQND